MGVGYLGCRPCVPFFSFLGDILHQANPLTFPHQHLRDLTRSDPPRVLHHGVLRGVLYEVVDFPSF